MRLARKGGILVVGNHYLKETINKIVEKKKKRKYEKVSNDRKYKPSTTIIKQ